MFRLLCKLIRALDQVERAIIQRDAELIASLGTVNDWHLRRF